eukprot:gene1385-12005_t
MNERKYREAKCSNCEETDYDKRNHKCKKCEHRLLYKCNSCQSWFENRKHSTHSPCNDVQCNLCFKSFDKLNFKNHTCTLDTNVYFETEFGFENQNNFVRNWLDSFGMGIYADELIKNGFDRRETIKFLNLEYISKMDVKIGHYLYILEKLEELKKELSQIQTLK